MAKQKTKVLRVGFDLDGVLLYNPARIARPIIASFKKLLLPKEQGKFHLPKNKLQKLIWVLLHKSSFTVASGFENVKILVDRELIETFIISGRYDSLKNDFNSWLVKLNAKKYFKSCHYNSLDEQPQIYKERMIKKLDLDYFIEDNWDIVNYLNSKRKKHSTKIFWIYNLFDRNIKFENKFPTLKKSCRKNCSNFINENSFFSTYFYPYTSGLTTFPLKILKEFARKNEVTVLSFNHLDNLPSEEIFFDIKIVRMPFLFKISKGFISAQSIIYFLRYVRKSDLILLNIPNFEAFLLALIAKIYHKKIISFFHCQVNPENNFVSKLISFFLNLSVYLQLLLSDKITATTRDYVDSITIGKLFRNKIIISLPPIEKPILDDETFKAFTELKKDYVWIGYVGRIASEKGIEFLVRAVSLLKKNQQIELIFAGPFGKDVASEEKYFGRVKRYLEELNVKHRFLGFIEQKNLGGLYKKLDILVLPSVNQTEAFGIVQAEAMLSGTPVIASDLPGVRVPIQMTKMGLIVEAKNSPQLALAIKKILGGIETYSNRELVINAEKIFDSHKVHKFFGKLINPQITG